MARRIIKPTKKIVNQPKNLPKWVYEHPRFEVTKKGLSLVATPMKKGRHGILKFASS